MLALAIEASGPVAGAALVTEEKTVAEFSLNRDMTHSQTLMPLADAMFALAGVDKAEIGFIACASGPGSFTGLRIGAAAAKGLAFSLGKLIVPVPALDALAYNVSESGGITAPLMDARRGQVYACAYTRGKKILEARAESLEDFLAEIRPLGDEFLFLGDGVSVHEEKLRGFCENVRFAPPNNNFQRAASVGALALRLWKNPGAALKPEDFGLNYLRLSQAERELGERRG